MREQRERKPGSDEMFAIVFEQAIWLNIH